VSHETDANSSEDPHALAQQWYDAHLALLDGGAVRTGLVDSLASLIRTRAAARKCQHGWRGSSAERIGTPCPACGSGSLFVGSGGHLTCAVLECPDPGVEHVVRRLKDRIAELEKRNELLARALRTWGFAYPEGTGPRLAQRVDEVELVGRIVEPASPKPVVTGVDWGKGRDR
jgi:hypothetical protein